MSLRAYLADHALPLLVRLATVAFAALVMSVCGVEGSLVAFACALLLLAEALATLLDWRLRASFWRALSEAAEGLEEPYLATEVVARPDFEEGAVAHDVLEAGTRAMRERVAEARRREREYREYAETWVHEIKTPIAAAHLVARNDPSPATEAMDEEVERIEGYVEQALYYARSTTLERDFRIREASLDEVVRQALRSKARPLIDARVAPELEGLDVAVRCDPKWLAFAIGQVLENAAKYRRPGTEPARVRISAERLRASEAATTMVLSIGDDGVGVPAGDVARVFEKGFTGENGRRFAKSTGMGLYLVRTLCDKMGIGVWMESEEGRGTTVCLAFPDSER